MKKRFIYKFSGVFVMVELLILYFASSCCNTLPRVTTSQATEIERTTAKCGGVVNDDGGGNCDCSERGVCWSRNPSPTISDSRTSDGVGIGSFTSNLTQLSPNTPYYVRAYATNDQGTAYGNEISFTTKDNEPPKLETSPVTSITPTSAVSGGSTIDDGGLAITAKGVCWAITENPDISKNKTTDGTGPENFTSNVTGLQPGASYHVRAYATNSKGTGYGQDIPFITKCLPPSATTNSPSDVTSTSAKLNGTVNANGNNCSTEVVFEYGTTTSYGSTVAASPGTVTGTSNTSVSATITGLTPGTTYHYRVKATNSGGTTTGADQLISPCAAPSASTSTADPVGTTTATLQGTVNANNSSTTVTFEYGLTTSYGTTVTATPSPVTGSSNTSVSASISGLTPGQTYHYRVKAVNCGGTTYGSSRTFITGCTAPTATTDPASPVGTTTATLKGTVNANNSSTTVTFEYGLTTSYGTTVTATPSPVTGSSNTSVSASISGLIPGQTYHYRVKAVNCGGTTYGSDRTIITGCTAPTATTNTASPVGTNTATLRGTVNANNCSTAITFEYGETTSYGNTVTATPGTVTGTSSTAVSANISGLTPCKLYHYRVKAVNSGGTTYGSNQSFTTSGTAPSITSYTATGVGSNSATLRGYVNANNSVTTVTFEYGKTTSFGSSITATPGSVTGNTSTYVSARLTGLTMYATYYYRVKAVNCGGTSYGSTVSFKTGLTALHDPVLAIQFNDNPYNHNMHIATDGNYYYTCNGGQTANGKINRYTLSGVFVASYPIAIDMRSIMFNKSDGYFYVSGFTTSAERNIYRITNMQTGAFTKVLSNVYDNYQSGVAMSDDGQYLFAFNSGTLKKYRLSNGSLVSTLTGLNYGTNSTTSVAVDPDYIYTWNSTSKTVYVYTHTGAYVRSMTLTYGDYGFSLSFVDGYLFVAKDGNYSTGTWYGYNIRRDTSKGEDAIIDQSLSESKPDKIPDIIDTTID